MELFRALAVLCERPSVETARLAEALELGRAPTPSEHTELFDFELYPYASVYLGAEGMMGGEARDRVAGFWRALNRTPPADVDHLSVLLALYARLAEFERQERVPERRASWRSARRAFLWEHLSSWLPVYLEKLQTIAPPFYRRWGAVLLDALEEEARDLDGVETLPLQLRDELGLADPRETTAAEFIQTLLAPARSGMIIVRSDLRRAARGLSLGARIGERKFVLNSLFGQDARATLSWLAAEADSAAQRHANLREPFALIARVWEDKARRSAALLRELVS
ncbi:MAG TPA: molecular chaperone TorD family protein [Pyrinomonadaceae bacterium]|nr:molecular chaperone TorD family protein [Pyrinomonadaceae bacterium]